MVLRRLPFTCCKVIWIYYTKNVFFNDKRDFHNVTRDSHFTFCSSELSSQRILILIKIFNKNNTVNLSTILVVFFLTGITVWSKQGILFLQLLPFGTGFVSEMLMISYDFLQRQLNRFWNTANESVRDHNIASPPLPLSSFMWHLTCTLQNNTIPGCFTAYLTSCCCCSKLLITLLSYINRVLKVNNFKSQIIDAFTFVSVEN